MTKHFLGLPVIGPWDTPIEELPFTLISNNEVPTNKGSYVVEVHPAVAIWLWCSHFSTSEITNWEYKKSDSDFQQIWTCLSEIIMSYRLFQGYDLTPADFNLKSDDELDALISWLLGKLFIDGNQNVSLLGSKESGSFLLPEIPTMRIAWKKYL